MRNTLIVGLLFGAVLALGAAQQVSHSQLRSVQVRRPNIVIRGAHLSKVEIWVVPTGTGISPDEYVLLGNAERANAAGPKEIWVFPIPSCETETRLLATEAYAKGFDAKGNAITTKSLPHIGATAVYEALCGKR
jgi:hypothetical protein